MKAQAEEAVVPELEKVKGNSLKKDMVKRRLVREYLEKNTDYYTNVDDGEGLSWLYSIECSAFLLSIPFIPMIPLYLLFSWSFSTEMAICYAFSVAASIILAWRRNYVLAPIAIGLAAILLYGLFNVGLDGVEMPAFHMVVENEGNIFLSPSHAEDTMWGSIVILCITSIALALYPFLKKNTLVIGVILVLVVVELIRFRLNMSWTLTIPTSYLYYPYVLSCAVIADLAVMLGISYEATILVSVCLAWLLPVLFALPAFIRSWKGMGELKERSPLTKKTKYSRLYYISVSWLIMNTLAAVLVWVRFVSISTEECTTMLIKNIQSLSEFIGMGYYATSLIAYVAPILTSALVSWRLFAITKQKIKLNEDSNNSQ